jgi:hypothetical protein
MSKFINLYFFAFHKIYCKCSAQNKVKFNLVFDMSAFARSNTEIVGSNPTGNMDVCMRLFCVCVVLCIGSGLMMG